MQLAAKIALSTRMCTMQSNQRLVEILGRSRMTSPSTTSKRETQQINHANDQKHMGAL